MGNLTRALLLPLLALVATIQPIFATTPTADLFALLRGKIKHVVVLMEENRSFDHIFGWGKRAKPPLTVDGLTGKETNPLNTSDPNTPDIAVSDHAPFINACDPNHGTLATAEKIFGQKATADRNFHFFLLLQYCLCPLYLSFQCFT